MKPLTRRMFAKIAAAAPVAASTVAPSRAAQMAMAGANINATPAPPFAYSPLANVKLMGLWKAGLAPEWLKDDLRSQAREAHRYVHPDLVSMRSISLTSMMRINRERAERKFFDEAESNMMLNIARQTFWSDNMSVG